jgi:adenylate cyclase
VNEVFTDLFEAVSTNKGIVDKYIGDAVMAVFGVPFASAEDPANAVRGALAMLAAIDLVNARPERGSLPPLRLGVGVATGEVVAGTIGSPKRMDYTVIGDSVNLASRMQDLTKTYGAGIIVCEETEASLPADIIRRRLDLIRVRGRQTPVALFEVLLPDRDPDGLNAYALGFDLLGKRDWKGAEAAFLAATMANATDVPAQMMLERARQSIASPPAADWDGVW